VGVLGARSGTVRGGDYVRGSALPGVEIVLAPVEERRPVGETHAIRATLTENGVPMPGRLVRFDVTGPNATSGTGTTDASGEVLFEYAGTRTGTDQIIASYSEPTRLYLSGTISDIAPAESDRWNFTSGNPRLSLVTDPDGSVLGDFGRSATGVTTVLDYAIGQFVSSGFLEAGEIAGRVRGMVLLRESQADLQARTQVVIRALSGDGTVERGILVDEDDTGVLVDEWATTAEARKIPGGWTGAGADVSPVTVQAGDRLVVEIGFRTFANLPSSSRSGLLRKGAPFGTADLGEVEGVTDDLRPWLEFSSLSGAEGTVSEPASVTWEVQGGGGGLRRLLSGAAVFEIVSPRGESRHPVVSGAEWSDTFAGGWKGAKGKISLAEFEGWRNVYVAGAELFVWERTTGTLLFRGELTEPTVAGGSVDLSARGPGTLLDKDAPRLLFSVQGGAEWLEGGGDPFDYDVSKKIGIAVSEEGIVWTIDKDRTFAGGEITRAVFYAEGFDGLSRVSWRLRGKDADYGNLEVVLRGRNVGEAGDFAAAATDIATWSLGAAGPANGDILEQAIADEYDLVELGLRATGPFTAADDIEIRARRLIVGGISPDDDTTADDVFAEAFSRIGCETIRIEASGVPVAPVDHRDGSYTSLLDAIALRADYYYRVYWEGGKLVGEAGSWGRKRYTVLDPEVPRDLIPLEPFDRVTVAFTYPNGAPGRVTVKAQTRKLPDPNPAPTIRISGRPMDDETAEIVAGTIADRLVLPRWSGSGRAHEVYDESGSRVHANIVKAGDLLYYPAAGAEVRVGEVLGSDASPSFRFTEGIPFLDRLATRLGFS
jgi:hypothetical protein